MSNTNKINLITPDLRDALLKLNLVPNDDVILLANNLGKPVDISTGEAVKDVPGIDDISDDIRARNIGKNPYQSETTNRNELVQIINNGLIGNDGQTGEAYTNLDHSGNEFISDSDQHVTTQTIRNQYVADSDEIVRYSVTEQSVPVNEQKRGYSDSEGRLNLEGAGTVSTIDTIGGFLSSDLSLGADGGIDSGFDIRSSIAGRVLGATGVIEETPLGVEAQKGLARALTNNIGSGLQQETTGRINTNPLDLLNGGSLFVENYDITVPKGNTGKVLNFLSRVSGVESPISLLENSSWQYSPTLCGDGANRLNNGTVERNNELIKNTGKGQINQLFYTLKQNCYKPDYDDDRLSEAEKIEGRGYDPRETLGSSPAYDTVDYIRESCDEPDGVSDTREYQWDIDLDRTVKVTKETELYLPSPNSPIFEKVVVTEEVDEFQKGFNPYKNKDSLLYKTKEMFNAGLIHTMITRDSGVDSTDNISTGYNLNDGSGNKLISKGSGVTSKNCNTGDSDLCRVWSTVRRYDQVQKLQKHKGLNSSLSENRVLRQGTEHSVLSDNGFVEIGPYNRDGVENPKRFMFSLENLAWSDHSAYLNENYPGELGPGDPLTGKKGRIMWFPPYGINFSDNSTVSLETNNFIGRGEPVYTYNHTERIGTIDFMLVVDHPSVLNTNEYREGNPSEIEQKIAAMFAGCDDPDLNTRTSEPQENIEGDNTKPNEKVTNETRTEGPWTFYFPNDCDEIPENYEFPNQNEAITATVPCYGINQNQNLTTNSHINNSYYGLNESAIADLTAINGILNSNTPESSNDNSNFKITITGFASFGRQETTPSDYNKGLSMARAKRLGAYIKDGWGGVNGFTNLKDSDIKYNVEENGENGVYDENIASKAMKSARYATIEIEYSPEKKEGLRNATKVLSNTPTVSQTTNDYSLKYSEVDYFKALKQTDRITYDQISEQLKYFSPAYHSTTPEGFNSRLNFLQQCLRQGPTDKSDITNLSFGRAPVCILRLGDFYHTKIIIDTLNISPEVLQWDLNPEGIGVQPMLMNVQMTFKIIGGSSLQGPINKLQNAVSFNYYANTGVYDSRADRIKVSSDGAGELVKGDEIVNNETFQANSEVTQQGGEELNTPPSSTILDPIMDQVSEVINVNPKETPKETVNLDYIALVSIFNGSEGKVVLNKTTTNGNTFLSEGNYTIAINSNQAAGDTTVATGRVNATSGNTHITIYYDKIGFGVANRETLSGGSIQITINGKNKKILDITEDNLIG